MKIHSLHVALILIGISFGSIKQANGITDAGGTLLQSAGARPAALGEAFSAMSNDITAFAYNPASLNTLESTQASFHYQQGISDDSFGQILLGIPFKIRGSLGLSIGYYDGGDLTGFDGVNQVSVVGQRDLVGSLGYAMGIGNLSLGLTGKYISSEIAETVDADAIAADVGGSLPIGSALRIGAAIQNMGSTLKYSSKENELPELARAGVAIQLPFRKGSSTLLLDAPYYLNQSDLRPAAGIETIIGPLSLRGGYQDGRDLHEFTLGAGFLLGPLSFDYAFGLVDELDSSHQVSMTMRWGEK